MRRRAFLNGGSVLSAQVGSITESSFQINGAAPNNSTVHLVVVANGSGAPTPLQIESGLNSSGSASIYYYNSVAKQFVFPVLNQLPSTDFDIYTVAKKSNGQYSNIVFLEATTLAFNEINNSNLVGYYKGEDYASEQWPDLGPAGNDLVKPTSRNAPTLLPAELNGYGVVDFNSASHQILESLNALTSFTDVTMMVVIKVDVYQAGVVASMYDTGIAYENTGAGIISRTNGIRGTMRNSSSGVQNYDALISDTTNYHIFFLKCRSLGSGLSVRTVLIDDVLHDQSLQLNSMSAPNNKLKLGSSWDNVSFNGKVAMLKIWDTYLPWSRTRDEYNFANAKYALGHSPIKRDIDFIGLIPIDSSTNEEYNGLWPKRRSDNKYDLYTATISGLINRFRNDGINNFTRSQLKSGIGEMQNITGYDYDNSGFPQLFTAHKTLSKIMVHKTTGDEDGPYTSADLVTGITEPQHLYPYDIDGDGVAELFFTYQGSNSSNGGIGVLKYTGGDPLNPSNYSVTYHLHPGTWRIADIFLYQSNLIIAFSARNNGVNANSIPGHYYVPFTSPGTMSWAFGTEVTINNTVRDWLHLRTGDFLGNGNKDLIGIALTTDPMVLYDGSNFSNQSTISLPASANGFNVSSARDLFADGSDAIWLALQNNKYYLGRNINGVRRWFALLNTNTHPGDNESIWLDYFNEGKIRGMVDDSENVIDGHVYSIQA